MMTKRERGKVSLKLLPKTPNLEAIPSHFDIMKKQHSTRPKFWKPGIDVMCDRIIGMQTVNVKHVKATIIKLRQGLIEGHSKQIGKAGVVLVVVLLDLSEYFLAIETGMLITLPRIDGIASTWDATLDNGLA